MRKISRERVVQLARDLLDAMVRMKSVTLLKDREVVRQSIADAIADEFKREEEREENVRRRISSMRKPPSRASREYEELFRSLMEEQDLREGLDSYAIVSSRASEARRGNPRQSRTGLLEPVPPLRLRRASTPLPPHFPRPTRMHFVPKRP